MTSQRGRVSSFVVEVLASAGRLDKNDLNARIGELGRRIEEVKVEVHEALQKKYADVFPNLSTAFDLQKRVQEISEEMTATMNMMENEIKDQLNGSTTEFHELSKELEESQAVLSILAKLVGLWDRFASFDLALKSNDYTLCATKLDEIDKLINTPVHDREDEVKIFAVLRHKFATDREKFTKNLTEIWSNCVSWVCPREGSKNCSLTICRSDDDKLKLKNAVQAKYYLEPSEEMLKTFGDKLFRFVLKPVMENDGIKVTTTAKDVAELKVQQKEKASRELTDVFTNTMMVVNFVSKHLFFFKVNNVETMELLGEVISKDFLNYFTTVCLAQSIPSSKDELAKYSEIASRTGDFQASLIKAGLLPTKCTTLTDYTDNVNSLFANKISQNVLEKARVLCTADMHNTVIFAESKRYGEMPPLFRGKQLTAKEKTAENTTITGIAKLSENTLRMPPCKISVAVQELVTLAYDTLHEAVGSSPACAMQLFYSVKNVFSMFCTVVLEYYKENLETLPQLAAIFHNNCMYVSHHLLTMGHQFSSKLPEEIADLATFMDLVPMFKRLGSDVFTQQKARLRQQLLDNLSETNGFLSLEDDFSSTDVAIRRVVHQLNQLVRVWHGILVDHIFYSSIGALLNAVLAKVCDSIIELNDIRSDDAVQLHSLLNIIAEKAPDLFPTSGNEENAAESTALLLKHVPKWPMFLELRRILSASLREIDERWADGKGPLAAELKADQVKKLIKALFQNTDRRARVVSKIRERSK